VVVPFPNGQLGCVPVPGQVVMLSGAASPEFRDCPVRILVTAPTEPSSVDAAAGHGAATSVWVLVTGWELNARGARVLLRTLIPARTAGIALDGGTNGSRRQP
jgi:hypothetical protein